MPKSTEILEYATDEAKVETPTDGANGSEVDAPNPTPEPLPTQLETDARALGYTLVSMSDANAIQDMLEQSIRNEAKAARKHVAWVTKNAATGKALEAAYLEHRQRTSRLYRMLTDGIGGKRDA